MIHHFIQTSGRNIKSIMICMLLSAILPALISCNGDDDRADASGNFEAEETIISAETGGRIISFIAEEGMEIKEKSIIGLIDTTELYLKKKQLLAQKNAVSSKYPGVLGQAEVQKQQLKNLLIEKARIESLYKDGAATKKQLDDINGSIGVTERQIAATETQNAGIFSEIEACENQIAQLNENLKKSVLTAPFSGTIIETYCKMHEMALPGKALYKIADLTYLTLRVYVSGSQLPGIYTGQKAEVLIDGPDGEIRKLEGTVTWISSSAEFTPKIIQTKEERINLVYAVRLKVKNDGSLKTGMPGEVNFIND